MATGTWSARGLFAVRLAAVVWPMVVVGCLAQDVIYSYATQNYLVAWWYLIDELQRPWFAGCYALCIAGIVGAFLSSLDPHLRSIKIAFLASFTSMVVADIAVNFLLHNNSFQFGTAVWTVGVNALFDFIGAWLLGAILIGVPRLRNRMASPSRISPGDFENNYYVRDIVFVYSAVIFSCMLAVLVFLYPIGSSLNLTVHSPSEVRITMVPSTSRQDQSGIVIASKSPAFRVRAAPDENGTVVLAPKSTLHVGTADPTAFYNLPRENRTEGIEAITRETSSAENVYGILFPGIGPGTSVAALGMEVSFEGSSSKSTQGDSRKRIWLLPHDKRVVQILRTPGDGLGVEFEGSLSNPPRIGFDSTKSIFTIYVAIDSAGQGINFKYYEHDFAVAVPKPADDRDYGFVTYTPDYYFGRIFSHLYVPYVEDRIPLGRKTIQLPAEKNDTTILKLVTKCDAGDLFCPLTTVSALGLQCSPCDVIGGWSVVSELWTKASRGGRLRFGLNQYEFGAGDDVWIQGKGEMTINADYDVGLVSDDAYALINGSPVNKRLWDEIPLELKFTALAIVVASLGWNQRRLAALVARTVAKLARH